MESDPGIPAAQTDERTLFDRLPLKHCLEYVVREASKHREAGHDDHFVQVGRVAQAALTWERLDGAGNLEEAELWLNRIPR